MISRTQKQTLDGHPEIRRDFVFTLGNQHEVPDARGHRAVMCSVYSFPNANKKSRDARQVPVFGPGSSLLGMVAMLCVGQTTPNKT